MVTSLVVLSVDISNNFSYAVSSLGKWLWGTGGKTAATGGCLRRSVVCSSECCGTVATVIWLTACVCVWCVKERVTYTSVRAFKWWILCDVCSFKVRMIYNSQNLTLTLIYCVENFLLYLSCFYGGDRNFLRLYHARHGSWNLHHCPDSQRSDGIGTSISCRCVMPLLHNGIFWGYIWQI